MITEEKLQRQNDRLELLLNLTTRITSSLDLREVLRAIAANIREVIHADAVAVSLPDAASGKYRVFAMDFPHGKGVAREELLVTLSGISKRAMDTLKPVVIDAWERNELAPDTYDIATAEGIEALCSIPLVNRGRGLGLLSIFRTTETPFSPEDVDFLTRASGQIAIAVENALAYQEISELKDKLAQEKIYLEEEFRSEMGFEQIIGNSSGLKHVLQLVETVAPSDSTVLLLGETGTGKELIARAIHDRGRRTQRTFVKLNCAAIPTGLVESELFGHEKGAFTGAVSQKIGRLELADQGTLFLDEVGVGSSRRPSVGHCQSAGGRHLPFHPSQRSRGTGMKSPAVATGEGANRRGQGGTDGDAAIRAAEAREGQAPDYREAWEYYHPPRAQHPNAPSVVPVHSLARLVAYDAFHLADSF